MNIELLKLLQKTLDDNQHELVCKGMDILNITWSTKITIRCKLCGHEKNITVEHLIHPAQPRIWKLCDFCNSKDLFEKRLVIEYGRNPYEFITPFKGYNEPIAVRCKDCGNTWISNAAKNLTSHITEHHPCNGCRNIRRLERKNKKNNDSLI